MVSLLISGRVDCIVFTGGIGEKSAVKRKIILDHLRNETIFTLYYCNFIIVDSFNSDIFYFLVSKLKYDFSEKRVKQKEIN